MTRIFTDGAEFGDIIAWASNSGMAAATSSPTPRSGSYYYKVGSTLCYFWWPQTLSEFYMRFGFAHNASASIYFRSGTTNTHTMACGADSRIQFSISTSLGYTTTVFSANKWYLLETWLKITDTGGRWVCKVNGVIEFDYTGNTKNGSYTTINCLAADGTSGGGYHCSMDDIAINSTAGTFDNSWVGDGRIEMLKANANGDLSEWMGSDGNQTDNYALVDDVPPNNDTDYVYSVDNWKRDAYNLGAYTDTGKIVNRIWAVARSRDDSYTGRRIRVGYKHDSIIYLPVGTSTVNSGDWLNTIIGSYALVDPSDGQTWSKTDLDSMQVVIESCGPISVKSAYTEGV